MTGSPEVQPRSKLAWIVLTGVLLVEAFGGLLLLVPTVLGMLAATGEPLGARLSIFLSALIAWIWVCAALFGSMRSRAGWARASAVAIHVLLFAAGTSMLQFGLGETGLAWGIIVLALVGFFAALVAMPRLAPQLDVDGDLTPEER